MAEQLNRLDSYLITFEDLYLILYPDSGSLIFDVVHHYAGASLSGQKYALPQKQAYTQAGNGLR
jgi:hypothetical protein